MSQVSHGKETHKTLPKQTAGDGKRSSVCLRTEPTSSFLTNTPPGNCSGRSSTTWPFLPVWLHYSLLRILNNAAGTRRCFPRGRWQCQAVSTEPVFQPGPGKPEETPTITISGLIRFPPKPEEPGPGGQAGGRWQVSPGQEDIPTYLLCVLELNIEPAWLDHCLTSCPQRKRRWKK